MAKKMKKILTAVLSLAMVACFVPQMNAPAYAEDGGVPAMVLGSESVLKDTANTDNAQTVWYAGKAWRVIKYKDTGNDYITYPEGQKNAMTLFSSDLLATDKQFNSNWQADTSNDYEGSDLQNTVNGLYDELFSTDEKKAVIGRTLTVDEYVNSSPYSTGVSGTEISGYLWPLSTAEALKLPDTFRSANDFWWLRSPGDYDYFTAIVIGNGNVNFYGYFVYATYGVRPAFDLNLNSVLFTSAAEGGKSSGDEGADALTEVGTNSGSEWKLTLLDDGTITGLDSHKTFKIDQAGITADPAAGTVTVPCSGAAIGPNEYISAIIKDSDGNIKYYGRIAEASGDDNAAGTVTINTAGKLGENDHLYVFNEQYNDDIKTDYASALQEVPIPKLISYTVTFKVKNGSWNDGTKVDQKVTLSRYDNEDKALVLQPGDIPKVGNRPASGYKAGSWDVTPKTDTQVSKDMTYTYTYAKAENPSPTPKINKAAAKIALDAGLKAYSSGSKVKASWGKVKGASSYVIYANYCDKKKCRKIKTVSGKTTSIDITKLNGKKFNPKKNLKFYVVAYQKVNGKKVKLARSIMAHAPGSKNSKRTNVTGVKVKKASFTLKKGKTAKIKGKLVLEKKNRKPLKHEAKFRYASSNKKVAKVSKKGKITAVGKGKCTVYVYAVSGVSKKIKVTVK